jgi:5'-3' exonuclease
MLARLHLVDGTYELFRAHFSKRPAHRAEGGRDRKATVGLASAMLYLLHEEAEAVTHLGIAFDNPIRSFRNALLPGYKTEEGVDPDLLAQFDCAEEAARALGLTVWSMNAFEADDALATAAARYSPQVEQVRILTPDKDLGQCIDGVRVVQVDRVRRTVIDEEALVARRLVRPASIPDLLALTGDDADGIPGVAGFGEKSAGALLARFGHVERVPPDPRAWPAQIRGAPRLAAALAEAGPAVLLYRRLALLRRDVPLGGSLEDLRFRGVPRAAFTAFCERLDARRLLERVTRWA